jgi:hypothetical protein
MATNGEQAAIPPAEKPVNAADGANIADGRLPHQAFVSQVPFPPYTRLANPGPLGLLGFAVTTFVLGLYQCGAG